MKTALSERSIPISCTIQWNVLFQDNKQYINRIPLYDATKKNDTEQTFT